jgi:hypothetical protein
MDSCISFIDKDFRKGFFIDEKFTNKTSYFVDVMDVNFHISLSQSFRSQIMSFLSKWFALFRWISC